MAKEILVIKHGALGDIILATGPMKSIRTEHPDAYITLLTAHPYQHLLKEAPFFDEIILDEKPKPWHFAKVLKLRKLLKTKRYDWVYDLQTSERTTRYYTWLKHDQLHYSGLAPGSHQHNTPERTKLHTVDRQKQQLEIAGITEVAAPDISWLSRPIDGLKPDTAYALLVPGGSAHRPEKRWPEPQFVKCAEVLLEKGITPIWIGAGAEAGLLESLHAAVPQTINLCNQTSFMQIAELARHAAFAIGNDTGPMHIIAATGTQSHVLFSNASNPKLCAPKGKHVHVHQVDDLADLSVEILINSLPLEANSKTA